MTCPNNSMSMGFPDLDGHRLKPWFKHQIQDKQLRAFSQFRVELNVMKQHCFHYRFDHLRACTTYSAINTCVNSTGRGGMLLFFHTDRWRKCRAPGTGHFTFIELKGATGKWIENKLHHPHWNDEAAMSTSHKSLISQPCIFRCNYMYLRQRMRLRAMNFSGFPINSMLLYITV